MARVLSPFPISGTIGGITYYKTKHGYFARSKSKIDKDVYAKDPRYQKLRQNAAMFGTAAKYGKLIRTAFRPLLKNATDTNTSKRVCSVMHTALRVADKKSANGGQNSNVDLSVLERFEFNSKCQVLNTFRRSYNVKVDRDSGLAVVDVLPFIPINTIVQPADADFMMFSISITEIDFSGGKIVSCNLNAARLALDSTLIENLQLQVKFTPHSGNTLIAAIGLEFFQQQGNKEVAIQPAALCIAKVVSP